MGRSDCNGHRGSLAGLLGWVGRADEAVIQLKKMLDGQERVLGRGDPAAVATRRSLAQILGRLGRVDEGVAQFEQLLED